MAMSTPSDPSVPPLGGQPVAGTGATDRPSSGYGETAYGESTYGNQPSAQGSGNGGGVKEKAHETASVVADQGKSVASTATDQARTVADTAKGQARGVTVEAKHQARRVLGDAQGELQTQLEQRVGQAADKARSTGGQLRALAEGRTDEAGPAADWLRQASDQVEQFADRINDLGLEGATQEVRKFARQRPMVFVGAAAAAGFLIGRTLKNAQAAQSSPGQSSPAYGQSGQSYGQTYGQQRPVAGIDPYVVEPDVNLAGGPATAAPLGSPLGTEVTPLGGGGGVIPTGEPR
jgi:ElaB/YqjD/DUF883 family membrane-anchored ribosome-binding protein